MNSRTYQASAINPSPEVPEGEACFAFYPLRRMEAEVLIDAINKITATSDLYTSAIPEPFTFIPDNRPAVLLPDGSITSPFLDLFGRSVRATGMENERVNLLSATQRMHLLNSRTPDIKSAGPGVYPVTLPGTKGLISNPVLFAMDVLPECLENETHDTTETAQKLVLPVIVNGRIASPGSQDVFRFEGRSGDVVVAEVCARRLGSPLDSTLKLTDASGKCIAFNDDYEDVCAGLNTHHADSYIRTALPADGAYFVHLSDAQHKGGEEYAYRLRVSALYWPGLNFVLFSALFRCYIFRFQSVSDLK